MQAIFVSHQVRVTKFSDEEWSDTVIDHEIEDFLGVTGPTIPLTADAKSVEYFLQLFPQYLFRKIADQTNL